MDTENTPAPVAMVTACSQENLEDLPNSRNNAVNLSSKETNNSKKGQGEKSEVNDVSHD